MELWIRSQDKEKILPIDKPIAYDFSEFGNHRIIYKESASYVMELGLYKSKERALEILDEIQENIVKQGQLIILTDERGIPNGSKFFSYVYEMPEE